MLKKNSKYLEIIFYSKIYIKIIERLSRFLNSIALCNYLSKSLNALPALKAGTLQAAILITSPV